MGSRKSSPQGLVTGAGVAAGFDQNHLLGGLDAWFLAIGFGFQLFFDFAGYSHIVIGAAQIVGFQLDENFDSPFIAVTPSEFWTRWHMSLSSWIRDYVYVPIATMRREVWWRYFALLLSMTLFGLWHGAKTTFVLWGTYQGLLLVLHRLIQQFRRNRSIEMPVALDTALSWAVSFMAVSMGWIFFRANDLKQALAMLGSIASPQTYLHPVLAPSYYLMISVVLLMYLVNKTVVTPTLLRIRQAMTPVWTGRFAGLGITGEFLTVVCLIPMVFMLFLAILRTGSEGMTPFVYAVF